jgi:cell division septation protein DedD
MLCGVFFALGYVVGTHTVPPQDAARTEVQLGASAEKPSSLPPPTYIPRNPAAAFAESPSVPADTDLSFYQSAEENKSEEPLGAADAESAASSAATSGRIDVVPPPPGLLVQISALSKREDAEGLVALLKEKNLPVLVTSGENDKLYHVVVGPYTTDADAQRAKRVLEQDGFRPFIRR